MNKVLSLAGILVLFGSVSSTGFAQTKSSHDRGLIVLDPGHGGSNLGASGTHAQEKHFTLKLARVLSTQLTARGFRVVMTRESDTYVSLRMRTALANKLRPDAFVSLHANASSTRSQRGFETFVLSAQAAHIDVPAMRGLPSIASSIERDRSIRSAARLARRIQRQLRRAGRKGNRGVKQAAMDVLMGARVPAVLVEVGFIDHPVEGKDLSSDATRFKIARALAEAIDRWSTRRR